MALPGDPTLIGAIDDARTCVRALMSEPAAQHPKLRQMLLDRFDAACADLARAAQKGVSILSAGQCPCISRCGGLLDSAPSCILLTTSIVATRACEISAVKLVIVMYRWCYSMYAHLIDGVMYSMLVL